MNYYKTKENGQIDVVCQNAQIARSLGLNLQTEKEIVRGYDGQLYIKGTEPVQQLDYKDLRRQNYPDIGEQLDMIYWDKVNNTNLWQEKITEIKAKYPKE